MSASTDIARQMRDDWNARAREDANYYVAFGRRDHDDEGFFATAAEVLASLDHELKRGTPAPPDARRILEIGCGPGRLMRPMSTRCAEIHGIDVSDEMIERAKRNLAGIPHAHVHVGSGATLDQFLSDSFDFVYSYAVFQHIPSRDVVFSYLRETVRVLKPGGLARLQLNGLPIPIPSRDRQGAVDYDTWAGVRISAEEVWEFAATHQLQLLALEGLSTQYMWTTWRKVPSSPPREQPYIARITNTFTSEPLAPVSGRFAAVSLWVDGLDDSVGLNTLDLTIGGLPATTTYLGRREPDGIRQLNALIPPGLSPGITTVALNGAARSFRLLPKPPAVPRVVSLTDGIELLSAGNITSGLGKLTVEEFEPIEAFSAQIDDRPIEAVETFCVDPAPPRHEVNFRIPKGLPPGPHKMTLFVGNKPKATLVIMIS